MTKHNTLKTNIIKTKKYIYKQIIVIKLIHIINAKIAIKILMTLSYDCPTQMTADFFCLPQIIHFCFFIV